METARSSWRRRIYASVVTCSFCTPGSAVRGTPPYWLSSCSPGGSIPMTVELTHKGPVLGDGQYQPRQCVARASWRRARNCWVWFSAAQPSRQYRGVSAGAREVTSAVSFGTLSRGNPVNMVIHLLTNLESEIKAKVWKLIKFTKNLLFGARRNRTI